MNNFAIFATMIFISLVVVVATFRVYYRERTLSNLVNIFILPIFIAVIIFFSGVFVQTGNLTRDESYQLIGLLVSSLVVFTITRKTGNRGVLLTLSVIPVINLLVLIYLALSTWPIQDNLKGKNT